MYCFGQWLFLSSSIFCLSVFLISSIRELTSSGIAYWLKSSNLSRITMSRPINIWSYSRGNQDLAAWRFVHLPRVELRRNIYRRVYMHGSRALQFKILHARQSKLSTELLPRTKLKNATCTAVYFSPENSAVHHPLNCYVHVSLIIIKKCYRAPYFKMLLAWQSIFYQKLLLCTIP